MPEETSYPDWVAYEPDLVPPLALMAREGITTIEEWFRWAEEWSFLLRAYGRMRLDSTVLEIGCGQGRTAFALRYLLAGGRYCGFDIAQDSISRLTDIFHPRHANFTFHFLDIHNTHYNPRGTIQPTDARFPAKSASHDLIYAASIFTHMLPENTAAYFKEAARVLSPGGRCVFSFFLLDNYRPGRPRPFGFARPGFNFDHAWGPHSTEFAIADPENPELMTAYSLALIKRMADDAALELAQDPVPGLWSGAVAAPVGAQDIIVLRHKQR